MQTFLYGLQVTVIGMLVVFAGLIILIGCVKIMAVFTKRDGKKNKTSEQAVVQQVSAPAAPQVMRNDTLVAVITAAVSAALAAETGVQPGPGSFTVRSIRRVDNAPVWNRAGREEQIYGRL